MTVPYCPTILIVEGQDEVAAIRFSPASLPDLGKFVRRVRRCEKIEPIHSTERSGGLEKL